MHPILFSENNIRVCHIPSNRKVSYCCFFIDTGTRDEPDKINGISHFIEHALFKGTQNRKAFHILSRLEVIGGELDAFTTKEHICIYASFPTQYLERAIELIADLIANPTFPEKEIEKEKRIVQDEIAMYEDSPSELIYDEFESQIFSNHQLSKNILGTQQNIEKFDSKVLHSFIQNNFNNQRIVCCISSSIDQKKVQRITKKHLKQINYNGSPPNRKAFKHYGPSIIEQTKSINQAHIIVGNALPKLNKEEFINLVFINNLLGGSALNSRLNLQIREKYGYSYQIESAITTYSDATLFHIYLTTSKKYIKKSLQIIHKEIDKIRDTPLSKTQLESAKKQLKGQLDMSTENTLNRLLETGKSLLNNEPLETIESIQNAISQITSTSLQHTANQLINPDTLSKRIYNY